MASGRDIWDSAEKLVGEGSARSANAMRFYALAKMLAEAETAMLTGDDAKSAEQLRELQAHSEKLVGILVPKRKRAPSLVAA